MLYSSGLVDTQTMALLCLKRVITTFLVIERSRAMNINDKLTYTFATIAGVCFVGGLVVLTK